MSWLCSPQDVAAPVPAVSLGSSPWSQNRQQEAEGKGRELDPVVGCHFCSYPISLHSVTQTGPATRETGKRASHGRPSRNPPSRLNVCCSTHTISLVCEDHKLWKLSNASVWERLTTMKQNQSNSLLTCIVKGPNSIQKIPDY